MKRLLAALLVTAVTLVGGSAIAGADNQPGNGETSTGRNDAGFGGGPHCHVVTANEGSGPFLVRAFPSHTGHDHAGDDVFSADRDCDGDAG